MLFKLACLWYFVTAHEPNNAYLYVPSFEHKTSKKCSFDVNFYYFKYTWHHTFVFREVGRDTW